MQTLNSLTKAISNLSLFLLLILPGIVGKTQDSVVFKKIVYKLKITDQKGQVYKGFLARINDSAVFMNTEPILVQFKGVDQTYSRTFHYEDLGILRLQRKSSIGRGVWMGAIGGFLIGAIVAAVEGADPETDWFRLSLGDKIVGYGGLGAASGCIVGGIIGALAHKRFVIHGSREKFLEMRHKLGAQ
ncbi:MAG TPA: hypothetical protein VK543_02570 [Puia sp.]|nr:hypothetical protein [Puia sp.]